MTARKFRIVLEQYGADAPEYEGRFCWTEDQAGDLLEIVRALRAATHLTGQKRVMAL